MGRNSVIAGAPDLRSGIVRQVRQSGGKQRLLLEAGPADLSVPSKFAGVVFAKSGKGPASPAKPGPIRARVYARVIPLSEGERGYNPTCVVQGSLQAMAARRPRYAGPPPFAEPARPQLMGAVG